MSNTRESWNEVLADEEEIVWIGKPEDHPYLREVIAGCWQRRGKPGTIHAYKPGMGGLVAYSNLKPSTERESRSDFFYRRLWHVHANDPYPESGHPCEAVEPSSIQVGKKSLTSTR